VKIALYVARTYAGAVALTLGALVMLVVAVNLIESAGDLSKSDAGALVVLRLAAWGAVEYAYQVLPIACFLGALVAGTHLARRGELLAVQAAGVGPRTLWLSFFCVVLVLVAGGTACGEYAVPRALIAVERIGQELGAGGGGSDRNHWYRRGDLVLYLPSVDNATQVFADPVLYRFAGGHVVEVIEAQRMLQRPSGWVLEEARVHSAAGATVTRHMELPIELDSDAADLIDVAGNPRHLSTVAVRRLIQRRSAAGFDTTAHSIEIHGRLAYPLLGFWMFLLAAPWTFDPDRRRSLAVTLGGGVVIIGALLAVMQVFRLAALGRSIPVALGAWGVSLVCITVLPLSLLLYGRHRKRGSIW
jgi:lipopolysaccharide export system permease protein